MKVRYFNDEGEELIPRYSTTKDVWYLDKYAKKPTVYHLQGDFHWLEDVAPLYGNDSFQYKIWIPGFWCSKCIWVREEDLYDNKKDALDEAVKIYKYSKIKYKVGK